jgi:hypothetical protein
MKEKELPPIKRRTILPVALEDQGEQAQEKAEELVDTQFTFRIVTIDGGKNLNVELPIPRLVGAHICKSGGDYHTLPHMDVCGAILFSTTGATSNTSPPGSSQAQG